MKLETRFGEFGGMYVPETLVAPLTEIEAGMRPLLSGRDKMRRANPKPGLTPSDTCPTRSKRFVVGIRRRSM